MLWTVRCGLNPEIEWDVKPRERTKHSDHSMGLGHVAHTAPPCYGEADFTPSSALPTPLPSLNSDRARALGNCHSQEKLVPPASSFLLHSSPTSRGGPGEIIVFLPVDP